MSERFRWIRGESVALLTKRLIEGPVDRVEFHEVPPTEAPGSGGLHIVVVYANDETAPHPAAAMAPINESWWCPPVCP